MTPKSGAFTWASDFGCTRRPRKHRESWYELAFAKTSSQSLAEANSDAGLVQMVSVLALNRLELREMLNQELVSNPVLEELTEETPVTDDYSAETFLKAETEKVPDTEASDPFDEFNVSALYQYLDAGAGDGANREREKIERPSFEKFLSSPTGLTEHLQWQLHGIVCTEKAREIAETIIGNLDEDGYLTASLDELR